MTARFPTISALVSASIGTLSGADRTMVPDRLAAACVRLTSQLQSIGARPNTPVCYIPPAGSDGAVAFLAVSSGATAAPLNPKATTSEIVQYVGRVQPSLVVLGPDRHADVASLIDVPTTCWQIGDMGLELRGAGTAHDPVLAKPDDVALILPTSGTTGLPKQVPLTHRQVLASADNIARWLDLDETDVSLTLMPLFHVHGLVAGLLAPLVAGGTTAVEGFDPLRFGSVMTRHRPTWFSAVPTMQAVLVDRWADRMDGLPTGQLRFLRTSSSALPPVLLERLETVYGVPVAEAYGMTEASHQIAANPIEPGARRPGTVGLATGTEIRIDVPDVEGRGEVLVRGEQITHGYRMGDEANETAFVDGWFRTGDEGFLDGGWLTLTGRLKEMINRGGEKISPIEVEEVLLSAPGVRACVVFALPHDKLGEDVGAVVVAEGDGFESSSVRHYMRQYLGAHKVPRNILRVDEIPLGPTGKVQRSRVAAQLGL